MVCIEGRDSGALEELGYVSHMVRRACTGLDGGVFMVRLEIESGQLRRLDVSDAGMLVEEILARSALIYSLPSQLKWLPYFISHDSGLKLIYNAALSVIKEVSGFREPLNLVLEGPCSN